MLPSRAHHSAGCLGVHQAPPPPDHHPGKRAHARRGVFPPKSPITGATSDPGAPMSIRQGSTR
eukprot:9181264-Pyramimonas_sp.AAC.1